ncbi:MAG: SDR family oxidoreductase [Eubacteriaceae bacterium]
MKKILLTGGRGFFCSRFTQYYKDDFEFLVTDKDDLDITDKKKVMTVFKDFRPDYVIHGGAIAVTDFCNQHPEIAYKINVKGALNVGEATKEVEGKLVFLSTEQVFNGNKELGPFSEEDIPCPDTVYGENKLEAEMQLKNILEELWIVRFTWMFGFPERALNLSPNILWETISQAIKGEQIKASPREFRGMTYVYEMIPNLKKLLELPYGTYHLGSTNHLSRYEIVEEILMQLGLEKRISELLVKDLDKYREKPRDVRLNTDKAKELGLFFLESQVALKNCIEDYGLKF